MLRFKSWRKSPALTQETTPSQRRITRILSEAQQAAAREMDAALPQVAEALARGQVDRVLVMLPTEPWLAAQEALAEELLGELLDAGSRVQLPTIEKATAEFSFDRGRRSQHSGRATGLVRSLLRSQWISGTWCGTSLPWQRLARQRRHTGASHTPVRRLLIGRRLRAQCGAPSV